MAKDTKYLSLGGGNRRRKESSSPCRRLQWLAGQRLRKIQAENNLTAETSGSTWPQYRLSRPTAIG